MYCCRNASSVRWEGSDGPAWVSIVGEKTMLSTRGYFSQKVVQNLLKKNIHQERQNHRVAMCDESNTERPVKRNRSSRSLAPVSREAQKHSFPPDSGWRVLRSCRLPIARFLYCLRCSCMITNCQVFFLGTNSVCSSRSWNMEAPDKCEQHGYQCTIHLPSVQASPWVCQLLTCQSSYLLPLLDNSHASINLYIWHKNDDHG